MVALSFDDPLRGTALGLVLLLLWLARPQRLRQSVSTAHLEQWRAALARLRRPRARARPLRLWLLVAAFACAVGAAAGPALDGRLGPRVLVALLDASPSMATVEPGGATTFALAREALVAAVHRLPAEVELRVVLAAHRPQVLRGPRAEVLAGLPSQASHEAGPTPSLAALAMALATDPSVLVWTFTDARGAVAVPTVGAVTLLGAAARSRGIVAAELHDSWPLASITLDCTIVAAGSAAPPPLVVEGGATAIGAPQVEELTAGRWRVRLALERSSGGSLQVALAADPLDPFALDDAIRFDLPPAPAARVGVLRAAPDDGDDEITRAAALLASLAGGVVVLVDSGEAEPVELLFVDGGRLADPPPRGLTFGTAIGPGSASPLRIAPRVVDWDRRDPLTEGLDLSELVVRRALPGTALPAAASVLVWGSDGPLVVAREQGGERSLHFAFRIADSNLALLAAFPQLLRRALLFTSGVESGAAPLAQGLLDPAESDLAHGRRPPDRPPPPFGAGERRLAVAFLLGAAALLGLRAWV